MGTRCDRDTVRIGRRVTDSCLRPCRRPLSLSSTSNSSASFLPQAISKALVDSRSHAKGDLVSSVGLGLKKKSNSPIPVSSLSPSINLRQIFACE